MVDGFEHVELSTYGRPLKPQTIKEHSEGPVAYLSVYSYTAQQQNFTDLHAQLPRQASADTVKTAIATEQRGDLTQRTFAVHDFRANAYEYSSRYFELRSPNQAILVVLHWSAADHVIAEEITEMCLSIRQSGR